MKRLGFFVVIAFLLIAGGALTTLIPPDVSPEDLPGALVTTSDPEASVFYATPWQTQQLVWLIGFILFNLIGIAVTIAIVMWVLNWGVKSSKSGGDGGGEKSVTTTE